MTSTEISPRQKTNRLQLVAILAIVLIPVLGSTFMFYTGIGIPETTSNHGLLIEPVLDVTDIKLTDDEGRIWSWLESGKFRLLLLLDGHCDTACEDLLYTTRQVHVRLAKRASSLERVLVQLDDTVPPKTYPLLLQLRGDFYQWRERLRTIGGIDDDFNGHQLLLVDRRGKLIMAFDQNNSGEDILKDVQFLVKSTL